MSVVRHKGFLGGVVPRNSVIKLSTFGGAESFPRQRSNTWGKVSTISACFALIDVGFRSLNWPWAAPKDDFLRAEAKDLGSLARVAWLAATAPGGS